MTGRRTTEKTIENLLTLNAVDCVDQTSQHFWRWHTKWKWKKVCGKWDVGKILIIIRRPLAIHLEFENWSSSIDIATSWMGSTWNRKIKNDDKQFKRKMFLFIWYLCSYRRSWFSSQMQLRHVIQLEKGNYWTKKCQYNFFNVLDNTKKTVSDNEKQFIFNFRVLEPVDVHTRI